ncbi:MAG: PorP/SprF family type IX secretion system membrane protein [Saprospiraceae bacterium]|nr:PorP/SprF family type IX secretion system membrane protein [Saprospiraceae bacterium]
MYNKLYHNYLVALIMCLLTPALTGQDIHFSQFHNAMMNINPGQTGVFNGDQRFTAIIRDQWRSVPVPYLTVGAAYDMRLSSYKYRNRFFGIGGQFNYDKAGDSKMALVNFAINGSYSQILHPRHIISGGVGVAINQRRFNEDELRWESQWDGDSYRPDFTSGENFESMDILFVDLSLGINYRFQVNSRTWINLGGGAFHLNQPDQTFYAVDQEDTGLPVRLTGSITSSFKIAQAIDLMVNGLYQFQNPYQEIVGSGLIRLYINNKPGRHYILDLGAGMRADDAFYPILGFQYNNWYLAASYDVNTSFFDIATNGRGGPEISLRYIYAKPQPPGEFKKCPVY